MEAHLKAFRLGKARIASKTGESTIVGRRQTKVMEMKSELQVINSFNFY